MGSKAKRDKSGDSKKGRAMYLTPTPSQNINDELYSEPAPMIQPKPKEAGGDTNYELLLPPSRPPKPATKDSKGRNDVPEIPCRKPIRKGPCDRKKSQTEEEPQFQSHEDKPSRPHEIKVSQASSSNAVFKAGDDVGRYPNVIGRAVVKPRMREPPPVAHDMQSVNAESIGNFYEPMNNPGGSSSGNISREGSLTEAKPEVHTASCADDEIVIRTANGGQFKVNCRRLSEGINLGVEDMFAKHQVPQHRVDRESEDACGKSTFFDNTFDEHVSDNSSTEKVRGHHRTKIAKVSPGKRTHHQETPGRAYDNPLYRSPDIALLGRSPNGDKRTKEIKIKEQQRGIEITGECPDDAVDHEKLVKTFTINQVCRVLEALKLNEYIERFQEWKISGEILSMMTAEDMISELFMRKLEAYRLVNYVTSGHVPI